MPQLPELLARIDVAKAELDALRPLDKEREGRVMQKFRLWWNYHSNAIEGNKLTQGETEVFLMEGLTAKGKPYKDYQDIRGHNDAINFLLSLVKDKQDITEADIRGLHKILLVEPYPVAAITPDEQPTKKMVAIGEYKTLPNHVKTRTGEIHYYAKPEETPAKMHDLMVWYREERTQGTMHPVEIIARFHHRFTDIHPFDDGNGRMSRLLMNLMLMHDGYPPAVIRTTERDNYLAALSYADRSEYDDFISFIGEHVVESLDLFIRAAKGEEVSEPTDLLKEIDLALIQLAHIEEPAEQTQQNTRALFDNSIRRLVEESIVPLKRISSLFTDASVSFHSNYRNKNTVTSRTDKVPMSNADITAHLNLCFAGESYITNSQIKFDLVGFRKGGFNTFDIGAMINVSCDRFKYSVSLSLNNRPYTVTHFYQESMSTDEIKVYPDQLGRFFLNAVMARTKDAS